MLSSEQARPHLPEDSDVSEEEVVQILDQLGLIADLALDVASKTRSRWHPSIQDLI